MVARSAREARRAGPLIDDATWKEIETALEAARKEATGRAPPIDSQFARIAVETWVQQLKRSIHDQKSDSGPERAKRARAELKNVERAARDLAEALAAMGDFAALWLDEAASVPLESTGRELDAIKPLSVQSSRAISDAVRLAAAASIALAVHPP